MLQEVIDLVGFDINLAWFLLVTGRKLSWHKDWHTKLYNRQPKLIYKGSIFSFNGEES